MERAQQQLFIEAFVSTGRVDNITMVMGLHPEYLASFWKTQYLLLHLDGPLPYHKRHYIAIMVSAWREAGTRVLWARALRGGMGTGEYLNACRRTVHGALGGGIGSRG